MDNLDSIIRSSVGTGVRIERRVPVSGGDINRAYALFLSDGSKLFMKVNRKENQDFFRAESEGLRAIRRTGTVRVPEVIAMGTGDNEAYLLLEHIESGMRTRRSSGKLGEALAAMHLADTEDILPGGRFGFTDDNFIGAGIQLNEPEDSWTDFFVNKRLLPQFERAASYFSREDSRNTELFLGKIHNYLNEPAKPSLLHGDLWAGNYMIDIYGEPWLIDPAVYVGHPEADLAMTELFGGFDRAFYDAYSEAAGIEPDYKDRRDIYNLYHLLNHLNLFGAGYLGSVRSIIRRYT